VQISSPQHEGIQRSRDTDPLILNLGTIRRRRAVSFTLLLLYSHERIPVPNE